MLLEFVVRGLYEGDQLHVPPPLCQGEVNLLTTCSVDQGFYSTEGCS